MSLHRRRCQHRIYQMACSDFDALNARAKGACELCQIPREDAPKQRLIIDHDHRIGFHAVRGLLCARCNSAMRMVDAGLRTADPQVSMYLAQAWHLNHVSRPSVRSRNPRAGTRRPTQSVRVPDDLWNDFGASATSNGTDRSTLLRDFIRWYCGDPAIPAPQQLQRPELAS